MTLFCRLSYRRIGNSVRNACTLAALLACGLWLGSASTSWAAAPTPAEVDPIAYDAAAEDQLDPIPLNPKAQTPVEWCQTQIAWEASGQGNTAAGCEVGSCDFAATRDSYIPTAATPIRYVRVHFNVFANNDGSSPAATQAAVDAQVVQMNNDYAPSKIQFCYTTEFINNTTYRNFADSEETAMKNAYADSPATQLNVYVVNIQAGYLGVGTFPWDSTALAAGGGLIVDDNWFGAGQKTMTHEVGHCLGLWHTHHGVSEVSACSNCYERADHLNANENGDFALDTDPTPTNYNCSGPGGTDSCSGVAWGATDPQNYMGYAPDSCYSEFSPQQFGRMHCWTQAVLTGWSCVPPTPTGGCCVSQTCSIQTEADCGTMGGSYLGDSTDCQGTLGTPSTYTATPNVAIPDNGGSGNPATSTITVPDSFTLGDVQLRTTITHTWVGDLVLTLQHGTTTVTLIDRPGYSGSGFGCDASNYSNIQLDDEGTLFIESQCTNNLTSPPNYVPNNALSTFDGQSSSGVWTIRVSDNASQDTGTLNAWSLVLAPPGTGPCAATCTTNAQCDDGQFCNGAETCVSGACTAGTAPNCSDGIACTTDSCNESTDSCDHTANNAACSDGLYCNGTETCNVSLGCQSGAAPNCADSIACTTDSCNETTDSCNHVANNAACNDSVFCNGTETCSVTLGCQSGTPPTCSDGIACTTDSCNGTTDSCDHIANTAACDDGLFCNGTESCNVTLGCQAGAAPNCNDGVACTVDSCNESTDSCDHAPNNAACDDGDFCNGTETCDVLLDCQPGVNPCTGNPLCIDCNGNGTEDSCDIASGAATDCNGNQVPDSCDIAGQTSTDCNGNAVPDECDMASCAGSPTCDDCDNNGTLDTCQIAANAALDCNANSVLDSCDLAAATSTDCNANQIPDECETCTTSADCCDNEVCTCNLCVAGVCQFPVRAYGDTNCAGPADQANLDDILCVLAGFGNFSACVNGDLNPGCAGNGLINLDDILAVLAAFGGADPCNCH